MIDCFIKKRWEEENILFYLHFRNKVAIRQIDILPQEIICLTIDSPNDGDYSLCDKELDDLDIDKSDYISEEEFNDVWLDTTTVRNSLELEDEMMEICLYNWERKSIMRWFNFVWSEKESVRFLRVDVEISKSIFAASLSIEVSLIALTKFKENLNLLYNQIVTKVNYTSCDGLLKVELFRDEVGHVYQMLHISDPQTNSCLVIKDYFDQTFLPELENSINSILK